MKIYKIKSGILIQRDDRYFLSELPWDHFINTENLYEFTQELLDSLQVVKDAERLLANELLPPVGTQEIWASGVTYYKSREARMDESKDAGGGDFYDRVYHADRPELFFKSPAYRAVGSGQNVRIRQDSRWNVPEPELTLVINSRQQIVGYTIGNDMSSRDIEGENPLYLPQAKSYDQAAAIGPCIWITKEPLSPQSKITINIYRKNELVFEGQTEIAQIKRSFTELVNYLFLETTFPTGALLMTGTGIIPPNEFTLDHGDEIKITIDHIGTLTNIVE